MGTYWYYTPKGLYHVLMNIPEDHPDIHKVRAELRRRNLPSTAREYRSLMVMRDRRERDGYERD